MQSSYYNIVVYKTLQWIATYLYSMPARHMCIICSNSLKYFENYNINNNSTESIIQFQIKTTVNAGQAWSYCSCRDIMEHSLKHPISLVLSLPARASEQGNVIGLVSIYIYI